MRLLLVGWPVAHSRSPAIHRAAFAAHHLDATYEVFPVPPNDLPSAIDVIRRDPSVMGFNVTVPHKEAVLSLVDHVEPTAARIGAVNTVVRQGSLLVGANTDAEGFVRALREGGGDPKAPALVIGAGGAARAVVTALSQAGAARIDVAARRHDKAAALCRSLVEGPGRPLDLKNLAVAFGRARTIVQATSATMVYPDDAHGSAAETFADALPWSAAHASATAVELVYEPLETTFLQQAAEVGMRRVDGLGMLLHQGALAFERWTGLRPPLDVMREALISD